MALIRCPKHGVPFNDNNPRGCPACALETAGGEQAQVMRELARASQVVRRPGAAPVAPPERRSERLTSPVTAPPRPPVLEPGPVDQLRDLIRRRPVPVIGTPLIVILLVALLSRSGPSYVQQPSPVPLTGQVLPLPIEPGASLGTVFGVLGVQPPRPSPEGRPLERYSYGTDLNVDGLNGAVYVISILVPNRSWRGLRVGMPQQEAEGALALLGPPQSAAPPFMPRADTLKGLVVYPSLEGRPNRPLKAEVRPPNGCYDVVVDIQPQAAGVLVDRDRRYAVIGPPEAQPEWVTTRIRVVNRAVAGPSGPAAC
jgi:hypothetical protein